MTCNQMVKFFLEDEVDMDWRSCLVRRVEPAGEGLEPVFSGFRLAMAETVRERAAFEFAEDTSDGVPISVACRLTSESCCSQRSVEVLSAIDEKHGGFDIVFLAQFAEKQLCHRSRGR